MLILAGVTISIINNTGILKNSQSAADKYEISDEQDVISVAFSTVFANSALTDTEITAEMLQKELDKTTRKTTVRAVNDTGKENLLYVKFDKTKNEHSIDITNGEIDFVGPYSEVTVNTVKNSTITMKADPTTFTNHDVTVTITYTLSDNQKGEPDKIVLEYALQKSPTTWIQYKTPLIIEENMTVYARLRYLTETSETASIVITNIDKNPPTATISPNGGDIYTMPSTGNATLKATPTIADTGVSGICTSSLQYVWSQSTTEPTSGWASFTNKTVVSKTDIDKSGNWYLWIRYNDNARNNTGTTPVVTRSEAFTLSETTDERNKITLTANRTDWVNQDVTVTVNYGTNLTESRTLSCNGTSGTDYTVNGTTNVIVKNNGKTVTATAKDAMGNMITASLTIKNIDKIDPTIAFGTNGASNITMPTTGNATIKTITTVSDTGGSGVYESSLKYVWSQSTTTPTSGWLQFPNGATITKSDISQAGTWYLYIQYNDNARNNTGTTVITTRSNAFTIGENTEEKNKIILTASTTNWTNQDVTVTVQYGGNLTQERTLSCNGTNNTDYTANGTTNVIVKTNGKTVTATAKDAMGNMITTSLTILNIDKEKPTITTASTTTNQITFTATDNVGVVAYAITTTNTAPTSGWTNVTSTTSYSTTVGSKIQNTTYYIWTKDAAGNVNNSQSVKTATMATPSSSNISYTTTWSSTGPTATVTFTTTSGFTIQVSTDGGNTWTTSNTATDVTSGTTIYVRYSDGTNTTAKYAAVTPILTYTIAYNANNGTGTTASSSHNYGTAKALTANGFSRTGYTFNGWNTKADGTGTSYTNSQSVTNLSQVNGSTVTLYAQWTVNSYTITYNANGGNVSPTSTTANYGAAITMPTPTRTGYTFNGWYTATTGGTKRTYTTMPAGSETVYAQWTVNSYKITYDANGGSVSPTSTTANYGAAITMPTPTRTGYTFNGWYTATTGGTKRTYTTMPAGSETLYAQWTPKTIKVTLSKNGGTGGTDYFYFKYGSSVMYSNESCTTVLSKILPPSRTGYTVDVYVGPDYEHDNEDVDYIAADGYTFLGEWWNYYSSDATFYVIWSPNPYTLSYDANGGTGSVPSPQIKSYGTSVSISFSPLPTKTGYTFQGWSTSKAATAATYTSTGTKTLTMPNTDLTLYAVWKASTYTLTIDPNGGQWSDGSTSVKSLTYTVGRGIDFAVCGGGAYRYEFDAMDGYEVKNNGEYASNKMNWGRTGYEFAGWSITSGGGQVSECVEFSAGYDSEWYRYWTYYSNTYYSSVTIKAQWTANTYTVSYNANNGSGAPASQTKTYGVNLTLSSTKPTRSGYTFLGWSTSSSATAATYSAGGTYSTNASVTLYAVWKIAATPVDSSDYGDYVNLGTSLISNITLEDGTVPKTDWRIFYKDSSGGIYLMLADFLPYSYNSTVGSGLATSSHLCNWHSEVSSTDLSNRLNDTNVWNKLLASNYISKGITVKGALDFETWMASWNEKGYTTLYTRKVSNVTYIGTSANPTGYAVNVKNTTGYQDTLYFPHRTKDNTTKPAGCWVTDNYKGTESSYSVNYSGAIDATSYSKDDRGVRPVVYIPSGLLTKGSDGIWKVIE